MTISTMGIIEEHFTKSFCQRLLDDPSVRLKNIGQGERHGGVIRPCPLACKSVHYLVELGLISCSYQFVDRIRAAQKSFAKGITDG